jgi:hypothetical protein
MILDDDEIIGFGGSGANNKAKGKTVHAATGGATKISRGRTAVASKSKKPATKGGRQKAKMSAQPAKGGAKEGKPGLFRKLKAKVETHIIRAKFKRGGGTGPS